MRSVDIYRFRAELSAEVAKRGVETSPEVFPPDDLPRPLPSDDNDEDIDDDDTLQFLWLVIPALCGDHSYCSAA